MENRLTAVESIVTQLKQQLANLIAMYQASKTK